MKRRILLVDDEPLIREAVSDLLRSRGYEVQTAASGEEGVEAARKTRFQLVLLDMKMPGMGGLEALRQMKAHDPDLPVIVFTGYSTIETAKEALRCGAADYLCKPVEPSRLVEGVRQHARTFRAPGTVLVVDDDPQVLDALLATLEEADIPAEGFRQGDQALLRASRGEGQVLLTDHKLANADGLHIISKAREARPDLVSILITGHPTVEGTVEALRRGAFDCLPKPVEPGRLLETVRRALEMSLTENLPGSLRPGRAYGVESPRRAGEIYRALLARGLPGLRIGRELPGDERPGPGREFFHLGGPAGPGVPSIPGPEQLVYVVEGFCSRARGAILIEGLEYLSAHEGFEITYRTLTALKDLAASAGAVLLFSFSPQAFGERERTLLAKELEVLADGGREEAWESASSGLFGEERTLYDLLRTSGGRKHQADLIGATGFSKARMSRLLDRMERKGLLRRQRDGMGNLVLLA